MNEFFTLKTPTEGFYKEKGSKFIGLAFPVSSEDEVKLKLEEVKKQYYDARHHCYAYIIGLKDQFYRANDDGEPNHSAGDPILGQIRSKNLTNCLVVVVRYFGGTKLGVGGLITAYKAATEDALNKISISKIFSQTSFELRFAYDATAEVERALAEFDIVYQEKAYTEDCFFKGLLKDEDVSILSSRLELTNGVELSFTD
ncbi:MAG: YigZ family protein [Marinoscillum sp.]